MLNIRRKQARVRKILCKFASPYAEQLLERNDTDTPARLLRRTAYTKAIMKKQISDLLVASADRLSEKHVLLKLTDDKPLPEIMPGQFVEVRVDDTPGTFLRRPISVCFVDRDQNHLWLLVATIGEGTRRLGRLKAGDRVNCIFPLGNGFTMPNGKGGSDGEKKMLLVGGGVGIAPLLYLGQQLSECGISPTFLLGGRSKSDLLLSDEFKKYGRVFYTTEDGTAGEQGFVTQHTILRHEQFDQICTCGPKPMMVSVARYAQEADVYCEASLENLMACGLGACLCCVEKTIDGNLCVCKEGPVFDVKRLTWLD